MEVVAARPVSAEPVTVPAPSELRGRLWRPLVIAGALMVCSAIMIAIASKAQVALPQSLPTYHVSSPTTAAPGYWGVLSNWDGQWYHQIATHGYPSHLPTDHGVVTQNPWAFYPMFPLLTRAIMSVTGLGFAPSAWLINVAAALVAGVVLYLLALPRMRGFGAGAIVACLFAFVSAPVFQLAYSESLTLLLIALCLWALENSKFPQLVVFELILSLTRPVVGAVGLMTVVVLVARLRTWRGHGSGAGQEGEVKGHLISAGVGIAAMGIWPGVAAIFTGNFNAYVSTQRSWPVTAHSVVAGGPSEIFSNGSLILLVVFGAYFLILRRAASDAWSPVMGAWPISYAFFIAATTGAASPSLRFASLMVSPWWIMPGRSGVARGRNKIIVRWLVLALSLLLGLCCQWFWVRYILVVSNSSARQLWP